MLLAFVLRSVAGSLQLSNASWATLLGLYPSTTFPGRKRKCRSQLSPQKKKKGKKMYYRFQATGAKRVHGEGAVPSVNVCFAHRMNDSGQNKACASDGSLITRVAPSLQVCPRRRLACTCCADSDARPGGGRYTRRERRDRKETRGADVAGRGFARKGQERAAAADRRARRDAPLTRTRGALNIAATSFRPEELTPIGQSIGHTRAIVDPPTCQQKQRVYRIRASRTAGLRAPAQLCCSAPPHRGECSQRSAEKTYKKTKNKTLEDAVR